MIACEYLKKVVPELFGEVDPAISTRRTSQIMPNSGVSGHTLTIVMTIMCYLACMALGALIIDQQRRSTHWAADISRPGHGADPAGLGRGHRKGDGDQAVAIIEGTTDGVVAVSRCCLSAIRRRSAARAVARLRPTSWPSCRSRA